MHAPLSWICTHLPILYSSAMTILNRKQLQNHNFFHRLRVRRHVTTAFLWSTHAMLSITQIHCHMLVWGISLFLSTISCYATILVLLSTQKAASEPPTENMMVSTDLPQKRPLYWTSMWESPFFILFPLIYILLLSSESQSFLARECISKIPRMSLKMIYLC